MNQEKYQSENSHEILTVLIQMRERTGAINSLLLEHIF